MYPYGNSVRQRDNADTVRHDPDGSLFINIAVYWKIPINADFKSRQTADHKAAVPSTIPSQVKSSSL